MFTPKSRQKRRLLRSAVKMSKEIILHSEITCPVCGHKVVELMPEDSCAHFYECKNCKVILKPKKGDCCIFCSYGTVPCPSRQN